jgi:plastocyanin
MKKSIAVLLILAALLLSSCGGGGPTTEINLTLTDFQFAPNTVTVPAGEEITLNVINNGAVVHNFIVMDLGESAGPSFEEEDNANVYWALRDIPPNGSESTSFAAPSAPGEYEIVCSTEGHITSGMVGKLIVVTGE